MYKKGHNSGRKIVIIELDLDTPMIRLHTTPSFNLTFRLHVITRKPKILQTERTKRA